jgi:hypothetical protein
VWPIDNGVTGRYNPRALLRRLFLILALCLALTAGALAPATAAGPVPQAFAPLCAPGYYKNVSGHCVRRPSRDPRGATAKCRDGTYSYSEHASGTCSHHGGVARWIHHP